MKKNLLAWVMIIGFTFNASAIAKNQDIHEFIQNLINSAFKVINNPSLTQEQKIVSSEKLMQEALDIDWMAQFSLGNKKSRIAADQLSNFKKTYGQYIVRSYSKKLRGYKGEKIKVKEVVSIGHEEYAVKTEIISPSQSNISIDFMVRKKQVGNQTQFFIFDVVTEGVSLISAQRSEFVSVINSKGVDSLISILKSKSK